MYKKENTEEYFYKNENKEEKPYGKPFVPPVPVQVLGEKVNGKESYYTADYDPLFSATQIPKTVQEKTEFFKPLKEDHFQELLGKDTELGKAAPNVVRNLGVISATEAALVTDVEILTKNRARHGNDVSNPYSTPKTLADDLKQGIIAFKPNGDISLIKSEEKLIKTINEARKEGYGVIPNPQWGWKQDDSNKQFYVPPERVNWEKDAKLVEEWQKKAETNKENPEYKEKASQGKEIYNLKIELEKHQYRETLIGNYGKEGDTLDPGYITSATAPLAKQKLQDLEKLYNKNIDSNKIENISAAKENVPLEAEIKQVNIPVAAPIQPRILENKPATQEIKKNTIASDASEKSENISTVKENVPASSVKKGEKNNPAPAGPNSVTDGPVAAPVQQVTLENKQATQKIQPNATAIDTSKNTENKTMTPKDVALDALNKEKLTVSKPVNSQNSAAQKDFSGKGEVRNLSTEKAKPRTISPDGQAVNEDIRKFDKALLKQVLKGFKEKDALKTVKVNSSSTGSPNPSLPTGSKSRQQNRKPQRG